MKKKYILNGKIYYADELNSYATKSGLSFDDYIKESGAKEHNDVNVYTLNGKDYDGNTLADFAKKSNLPYDEYLKEAGVKKKDGQVSAEPVQNGITTSSKTSDPNAIDVKAEAAQFEKENPIHSEYDSHNPIDLANQSEELSKRTIAQSGNPLSGTPTNPLPDKEAIAQSEKIDKAIEKEGYNRKELNELFGDFPKEAYDVIGSDGQYNQSKDVLLEEYKADPIGTSSKIGNIKTQFDIRSGAYQRAIDNGASEDEAKRYAEQNGNYFQSLKSASSTPEEFFGKVKAQQKIIGENLDGQQKDKALARVKENSSQFINAQTLKDEYDKSEFKSLVDPNQFAGLKTLELFDPAGYEQAVKMLQTKPSTEIQHTANFDFRTGDFTTDVVDTEPSVNQQKGQEAIRRKLADIGRNNAYTFLQSQMNNIGHAYENETDEAKKEQLQNEYLNLQSGINAITDDYNKDYERYPLSAQMQLDDMVKEIMNAADMTPLQYGVYRFGKGFNKTGNTFDNWLTGIFGNEKANTRLQMQRLGEMRSEESESYLPTSMRHEQPPFIEVVRDKYFTPFIDKIKNDPNLTDEEKKQQVLEYLQKNKDNIQTVTNPNAGKHANFFSKATLYGNAGLLGDIGSIAVQSMGLGAAGAKHIISATVPMFTTVQDDFYKEAIAEGNAHPMQYANTHATIMALAGLVNPNLNIVKRALGKTVTEKLVAGIDESTWNKVVNKNGRILNSFKSVVKEAGKMATVYGAGTSIARDLANKYIFSKEISGEDMVNHAASAIKDVTLNSIALFGMNAISNFKTVSPEAKGRLWELGSNKEISFKQIDEAVKKNGLSQHQADEYKKSIKEISGLIEDVPQVDKKGKPLTDKQRTDYLFNLYMKSKLSDFKSEATEKRKEHLDNVEAEIDKENSKIITNAEPPKSQTEPTTGAVDEAAPKFKNAFNLPLTISGNLKEEVTPFLNEVTQPIYKNVFENGSEKEVNDALKEVAQQANASEGEKKGAISTFGENIVKIAQDLFPNEKVDVNPEGELSKLESQPKATVIQPSEKQLVFKNELIKRGLSEKAAEGSSKALMMALDSKESAIGFLHPDNKNLRELWSSETGMKLPKTVSGTKSAIESYFVIKDGGLKPIEDIIKSSNSFEEAFAKIKSKTDVPKEVAQAFRNKYDPNEKLTPEQTFKKFYDEIKSQPSENKPPNVVELQKETESAPTINKSDAEIEKRMLEIQNSNPSFDSKEQKEFNDLEKEMEKRERATVFDVPLEKVSEAVDKLISKNKDQSADFGAFMENRDGRETKEVAEKYLSPKEISDAQLKKDFKDAVLGNPDTWYADGLKLRESMKEAANRGIDIKDMIAEVEKEYVKDGYSGKDAHETVARKLKPVFESSQKVNKKQGSAPTIKEEPTPQQKKEEPKQQPEKKEEPTEPADKKIGKYEAKAREIADKINNAEIPQWLVNTDPTLKKSGVSGESLKKALADAVIHAGKLIDKGVEFKDAVKEAADKIIDHLLSDYPNGAKLKSDYEKQVREGFENYVKEKVQTEDKVSEGEGIKIHHAGTDEIRKEVGLGEYEKAPQTVKGWNIEADKRIANGEMPELIRKIQTGEKQTLTEVDQIMMGRHIATVESEVAKNPSNENLKALKDAIDLSDKIGGSAWGRSGRARQEVFLPDDRVGVQLLKEMESMGVDELTPAQKDRVIKETEEINKARIELEAANAKLIEENNKLKAEQEFNKKKEDQKKSTPKGKEKTHDDFKKERDTYRDELKSAKEKHEKWLKDNGIQKQGGGLPPLTGEMAKAILKIWKSHAEETIIKFDELVNRVYEEVKDLMGAGFKKSDIIDVAAGVYSEKKETRNEKAARLHDLKTEAILFKKLQDLRLGKEEKNERNQNEKSRRALELENKIKEVRERNNETYELVERTDGERLAAIRKAIEKKIYEIQQDIKAGRFEKREPLPPIKLDAKTQALQDRLVNMEAQQLLRRSKNEYDRLPKWVKVADTFWQVMGLKRLVNAAVDFSIPFRQASLITMNPFKTKTTRKSFVNMFNLAFSPEKYKRFQYELEKSEKGRLFTNLGGVFSNPTEVKMEKREEEFSNSLLARLRQKIDETNDPNLIKAADILNKAWFSERAAAGFLNTARIEEFKNGAKTLKRKGLTLENAPKEYKDLVKWTMNKTGRGNMMAFLEDSHTGRMVANRTFFGARLMAAKINMLNPVYYAKMPPAVRAQAIKDMAGYTGGLLLTGLAAVAAGGKVNFNWDDPDFLQIRFGDKVYDISGGSVAYVRTFLRVMSGVKKAATNPTASDTKSYLRYMGSSVWKTMFVNKLAPNNAYLYHFLTGKSGAYDENGKLKPFDPYEVFKIYPLYVDGTLEAYKEGGLLSALSIFLPDIFGVGTQQYEMKGSSGGAGGQLDKKEEKKEKRVYKPTP